MTFLDRLEKRLGHLAVPGLVRYVVALNALVFILVTINPEYTEVLRIDRGKILEGEVWRLVSWIFIPNTTGYFWIIFYLLFTWWIGDMLEQNWGTFRLNAYYFLGILLSIASALVFGSSGGNFFLNLSLFLAVATLAPNYEILLFLILPVKMKWVAAISLILPAAYLLLGPLSAKMMVVMCLGNYLLFFGPGFLRERAERGRNRERRERFTKAVSEADETMHKCEVCGITEITDPDAEFRVSADGREYCMAHLPSKNPPAA
jgi:hypothetical protein